MITRLYMVRRTRADKNSPACDRYEPGKNKRVEYCLFVGDKIFDLPHDLGASIFAALPDDIRSTRRTGGGILLEYSATLTYGTADTAGIFGDYDPIGELDALCASVKGGKI